MTDTDSARNNDSSNIVRVELGPPLEGCYIVADRDRVKLKTIRAFSSGDLDRCIPAFAAIVVETNLPHPDPDASVEDRIDELTVAGLKALERAFVKVQELPKAD